MQTNSVEITVYKDQYQDQVIALWHVCGLVVPWNDPQKDIQRKMDVGLDLFLVGLAGEDVVATAMGGYEGHRGWVNYLAVSPQYQRSGLGKLMMDELEARLIQKGCPKINLQVRTSNTSVIAFYESLGYRRDDAVSLGKRLIKDD